MAFVFSPTHRRYMDELVFALVTKNDTQIRAIMKRGKENATTIRREIYFWSFWFVFVSAAAVAGCTIGITFIFGFWNFIPFGKNHIVTHVNPQRYGVCHAVLSCIPRKNQTVEGTPRVTYHMGYMNHVTAMTLVIPDEK